MSLNETSLKKCCYNMLYASALNGRKNWASKVRDILFEYGFGHIWEEQNTYNVQGFLYVFKERMRDCFLQSWSSRLRDMPKLRMYR